MRAVLAEHVPEPLGKDLYIHRVGLDPRNCLLEGPGTAHDKTVGDLKFFRRQQRTHEYSLYLIQKFSGASQPHNNLQCDFDPRMHLDLHVVVTSRYKRISD
jgi:hypothetical protein